MQTTQHVMMIRPARFESNAQTHGSNAFQQPTHDPARVQEAALSEFDAYVAMLRETGLHVTVIADTEDPHTPDSIFPNNWMSCHEDGTLVLYPMEAPNRRLERRPDIIARLREDFEIRDIVDLSDYEQQGLYLEGTGSMVLDRDNRIAYVCHASRSHDAVMQDFCDRLGYRAIWFHATDGEGRAIYHTNVMMSVGRILAIVCLESLPDAAERAALSCQLAETGKRVLPITLTQVRCFAGNVIELQGSDGRPVFAMSRRAWEAFEPWQQQLVYEHGTPLAANLDTIETQGGGGARCMIAEIHLPRRSLAENGHPLA